MGGRNMGMRDSGRMSQFHFLLRHELIKCSIASFIEKFMISSEDMVPEIGFEPIQPMATTPSR